jgi:hypothetical protein
MAKMIISENRLQELINESIYEVLQEAQYNEGLGTLLGNGVRNAKKLPSKIKNSWDSFKNDFNAAKNNEPQDNQDVTGKPRSLAGLYGYAKTRYKQRKKDWNDKVAAGRNYAYYKYKDRDVVGDEYGQEIANNIRDYDTEAYRQDRLNNWRIQRGLEPQGVQPRTDLAKQPNKLQQGRIDNENSSNFIGVSPHPGLAQNTQNTQNNQNKKKRRKKKKNNGQQQGGQQQPVQPQGGQQQPVQP